MFIIRQARPDDVSTLHKLARMVFFINLPPNDSIIAGKIEHSARCFRTIAGAPPAPGVKPRVRRGGAGGFAASDQDSDLFMFSVEDVLTRSVVGTSQVRAQQGGPGNPNWAFKITEKSFRSDTLGWGSTHKVGRLYGDETGPTEVGGLIIQPSYRGHPERPGRLLSFIRFHLIGLHRAVFADRVLAEMMAPVSPDGDNLFWDHFGRKFIPVRYGEADRFCQHNRGFIPELLPKDEIYLSLFPLEVQNQIGAVSRETIPARRLLESLGFRYRNFVDPFDGGPHLDAPTGEIPLVRDTRRVVAGKPSESGALRAIVSTLDADGEFRGAEATVALDGETARLHPRVMDALSIAPGAPLGVTPLPAWAAREAAADPRPDATAKAPAKPAARKPKPAARGARKIKA